MTSVTLPDTAVHRLHADAVGDDFELWVAHPRRSVRPPSPGGPPASPPGPPRALWVLDANLFFGLAVDMTRLMHALYGELPPFLVIGVAHPTDDPARQAALRARDFTPTADAGMAAMAAAMPRPEDPPVEPAAGGADFFLRFLLDQARPLVRDGYEVAPEGDVLFGSSLGGLFAAWTLLTAPGAFDACVVASPALWWNDETVLRMPMAPADGAEEATVPPGPDVFLAAGSLEEDPRIPMLARFKLVSNTRRFADRLRSEEVRSLRVGLEVLEGETHTSVVPVALTRGLRWLVGREQKEG